MKERQLNPEVTVSLRVIEEKSPAMRFEECHEFLIIFLQAAKTPECFIELIICEQPVYVGVKLQIFVTDAFNHDALERIPGHPSP